MLVDFFSAIPATIATFLLAMLPITELRGSIPIGILTYQLPPLQVLVISIAGNLLAGYIVLFALAPAVNFLKTRFASIRRLNNWWFDRVERNFAPKYKKYGPVALAVFVAIPLPMTGAWTGAAAAWLFQIPRRLALWYLALGVVVAGIVVTLLTAGVDSII